MPSLCRILLSGLRRKKKQQQKKKNKDRNKCGMWMKEIPLYKHSYHTRTLLGCAVKSSWYFRMVSLAFPALWLRQIDKIRQARGCRARYWDGREKMDEWIGIIVIRKEEISWKIVRLTEKKLIKLQRHNKPSLKEKSSKSHFFKQTKLNVLLLHYKLITFVLYCWRLFFVHF